MIRINHSAYVYTQVCALYNIVYIQVQTVVVQLSVMHMVHVKYSHIYRAHRA